MIWDYIKPSEKFENYYNLVISKYLVLGIVAYIGKELLSIVLVKYIHWIIGLAIALIITVVEFFSMRAMRSKIPEGGAVHAMLNLVPGMKYVHMYAINEI